MDCKNTINFVFSAKFPKILLFSHGKTGHKIIPFSEFYPPLRMKFTGSGENQ